MNWNEFGIDGSGGEWRGVEGSRSGMEWSGEFLFIVSYKYKWQVIEKNQKCQMEKKTTNKQSEPQPQSEPQF